MTTTRKSFTAPGKIYFWTATIHKWQHLLHERHKALIIDYLKKLSADGLVTIYGFVIMPNHIHLIWQQNKKNGKENAFGSFLKYTAHRFLKDLKSEGQSERYKVDVSNKLFEIWQRDSLAIEIYSRHVAVQKLGYIHANPVSGIWKLAKDDLNYYYSSARFYETGVDDFGFLNNLFFFLMGNSLILLTLKLVIWECFGACDTHQGEE